MAEDVSQNVPVGRSMKQNFVSSAKNVGRRVLRGGGKVRKAKRTVKRKKPGKRRKSRKTNKRAKKGRSRKKKRCNSKSKGDIFSSGIFAGV